MSDAMIPPDGERPGRTAQPDAPARSRRRDTRLVVTGVALVLLIWFAVANLQDVKIHFWLTSANAPLIVVVAISGFLGLVLMQLSSRVRRRRRSGDEAP
jgi:uncharacterized integral membrane protein